MVNDNTLKGVMRSGRIPSDATVRKSGARRLPTVELIDTSRGRPEEPRDEVAKADAGTEVVHIPLYDRGNFRNPPAPMVRKVELTQPPSSDPFDVQKLLAEMRPLVEQALKARSARNLEQLQRDAAARAPAVRAAIAKLAEPPRSVQKLEVSAEFGRRIRRAVEPLPATKPSASDARVVRKEIRLSELAAQVDDLRVGDRVVPD